MSIIGSVFGFFSAFAVLIFLVVVDVKIDASSISNVIVAVATCVATCIHMDSVWRQRKERVWELNKSILLDLAGTVSKVISQTSEVLDALYSNKMVFIEDAELYKNVEEQVNSAINVYSSFMPDELVVALRKYQREALETKSGFQSDEFDQIDAYERQYEFSKALYQSLKGFIAEVAGI